MFHWLGQPQLPAEHGVRRQRVPCVYIYIYIYIYVCLRGSDLIGDSLEPSGTAEAVAHLPELGSKCWGLIIIHIYIYICIYIHNISIHLSIYLSLSLSIYIYIYIYIYIRTISEAPVPEYDGAPNLCEDLY